MIATITSKRDGQIEARVRRNPRSKTVVTSTLYGMDTDTYNHLAVGCRIKVYRKVNSPFLYMDKVTQ